MARIMRTSALLVALIVLAGYWAGAAAKKDKGKKGHEPTPAPYEYLPAAEMLLQQAKPPGADDESEYSPAAEVLVQQAKAPGADGGSYITAARHVAPAPQVDQIIQQVQSTSTAGESANLQAAKEAADSKQPPAG